MRIHGIGIGGLALAVGLVSGYAQPVMSPQAYGQQGCADPANATCPGEPIGGPYTAGPYGYSGGYSADEYYGDGVSWDDGVYGFGGGYWGGYGGYGQRHFGGGGRGFGGGGFHGSGGFHGGGGGFHGGGGGFHGGGGSHGGGGHGR